MTATVEPGLTFAAWITAPTPVSTPQPTSAARSSGTSGLIFTNAFSCTSICSAKDDRFENWCTRSPFRDRRSERPGGSFTSTLSHRFGCPVTHCGQLPQNTDRQVTTWSPGFTWVTSAPTCSTIPDDSWPGT